MNTISSGYLDHERIWGNTVLPFLNRVAGLPDQMKIFLFVYAFVTGTNASI